MAERSSRPSDPAAPDEATDMVADAFGARRDADPALQRRAASGVQALIEVMARLRAPDGCPWDQEQSFESIAPYTIEEAYEVADAIARGDLIDLRDELGDLLLQVVYHARIAEERGAFDAADVADAATRKMIRRHPHVFAGAERGDWEAIKAAEKAERAAAKAVSTPSLSAPAPSVLDDVPAPLPALMRAEKLQRRAARVGFDWPDAGGVLDKLSEEVAELLEASAESDADAIEDEFGDLLFVMVNLGRHLKLDAEGALRRANAKFTQRFKAIEAALAAEGRGPEHASLEEMEALWVAAKRKERAGP
ncbi:MAG: nucleoside triphosphate pyrophosphohydrolase [Pseudomonadota bacterium]